jgi:hypothetical protein
MLNWADEGWNQCWLAWFGLDWIGLDWFGLERLGRLAVSIMPSHHHHRDSSDRPNAKMPPED